MISKKKLEGFFLCADVVTLEPDVGHADYRISDTLCDLSEQKKNEAVSLGGDVVRSREQFPE